MAQLRGTTDLEPEISSFFMSAMASAPRSTAYCNRTKNYFSCRRYTDPGPRFPVVDVKTTRDHEPNQGYEHC